MPSLKENREEYARVVEEQRKFFADHSDGQGGFKAIGETGQTACAERNLRMEELQKDIEQQEAVENMAAKTARATEWMSQPQRNFAFGNGGGGGQNNPLHPKGGPEEPGTGYKSFFDIFMESEAFKSYIGKDGKFDTGALKMAQLSFEGKTANFTRSAHSAQDMDAAMKATMTTTAGYPPFIPRLDLVIPSAQRRPVIADLIPTTTYAEAGIRYLRETTYTNNGSTVAEGQTKPESALDLTEIQGTNSKIANSIKLTEEQLADVPTVRTYVDGRLTLMMLQTEETELLNGSGTSPDLTGFLTTPGINVTPKVAGADAYTTLLTGIYKIQSVTGFADVNGQVMHPMDWLNLRTKQDTTGRFILGDPNAVVQDSLWGKKIIPTIAIALGTVLQGDFANYSHLYRREEINFRLGYVNDDFIRNLVTIICEMRELLALYRPSAFGTVTSAPLAGASTF